MEAADAIAGAEVVAPLTFLADTKVKAATYNPPPGTGEVRRTGNYGSFPTRIRDARPIARWLSLEREGFRLARRPSAVRDFHDEAEIRAVYYPEVERLVAEATGAAEVAVFDHTIRAAERAVERGLRQPVRMVHNDYTEKSGPQRVRELLGERAEEKLRHRFVEINVWRPIRGPVLEAPLALADAQSLAPGDLAPVDLVYADRVGEIYYGVFNPKQRWYYFPRMTPDEAILIKCYDSERDGRARFSLHSAFDDPTTPANAPPRESIEVRAFAFFS
jgi:hypothetical protein